MEKEAKKLYKSTKEKFNKAKRSFVCKSLKDVIRGYRNCKTAAEERAYVKKESAHIRDLFREEDVAFRRQNVCKLLFFHMNGYKTEWGQIQCLKLCASPKYKDKRVGYLGLTVLLDEKQEILMMMTNCLKIDLLSTDVKVVSLALTALGNISTPDMIRDLLPDVLKLLQIGIPQVRKKAALVGARAVKKLPELSIELLPQVKKLLSGRSGAVFLTTTTLAIEIAKNSPELIPELRKDVVPMLADLLRELSTAAYDPDLTVSGVTDPFMQVQAIRALGFLAKGDHVTSESIVDIITQVITSTDGSKNSGAAVLSECVKTIYKIEAPASLRALALNQLGSFLRSKDANFRYVALCQLATVFHSDPAGVKSHLETIVECLHEPDPSIRHRAVDLTFAISDETNVERLSEETLAYIDICDAELKEDACTRLIDMADRLGPSPQWKVDTFIRLLLLCDEFVQEELCDVFISMISSTKSVQEYAAEKVYTAILLQKRESIAKRELQTKQQLRADRVAAYIFGEYGDLVTGRRKVASVDIVLEIFTQMLQETEENVFSEDLDRSVMESMAFLRQVVISASAKLVTKLVGKDSDSGSCVREETMVLQTRVLMANWRQSLDLEAQQRACEFSTLLTLDMETIRSQVLSRMPPIDYEQSRRKLLKPAVISTLSTVTVSGSSDLISLIDAGTSNENGGDRAQGQDPLADILGLPSVQPTSKEEALTLPYDVPLALPSSGGGAAATTSLLDDILGPTPAAPTTITSVPKTEMIGPIPVTQKDGLGVSMVFRKEGQQPQKETQVVARFVNNAPTDVTRFAFQLSVPKYIKLSMHPATSSSLSAGGGSATQLVALTNTLPGEKPLQLRFRIEYERTNGILMHDQGLVTGIPKTL